MDLTIALNRYDRHVPFFNGTVSPPKGIAFKPLEVGESSVYRDGTDRHERMLKHLAFDIAEMSLSTLHHGGGARSAATAGRRAGVPAAFLQRRPDLRQRRSGIATPQT